MVAALEGKTPKPLEAEGGVKDWAVCLEEELPHLALDIFLNDGFGQFAHSGSCKVTRSRHKLKWVQILISHIRLSPLK